MESLKKKALEVHKKGPGKLAISSLVPLETQFDLSILYTPGVGEVSKEIAKNRNLVYDYTSKSHLVAVVSDGSAVLGLGNIGPEAALPVMEGKALLFKRFANVDAVPIVLDTQDPDEIINIVKAISPGFGGINLEDISAPRCFEIEKRLIEELNIPVFHDDQHGTAIVVIAGLINALKLVNKTWNEVQIVINGAGAAGIAIGNLLIEKGVKKENIVMLDSKGVIREDRSNLNEYKRLFATSRNIYTLEEAMKGADIFIGVSVKDIITPEMLLSMNKNPIIFAMANPDPEIKPEIALNIRKDIIIATGRSDYPNQVNNVLAFPFIFRVALDLRLRKIDNRIKLLLSEVLAEFLGENITKDKIIPSVFDEGFSEFVIDRLKSKILESSL